MRVGLMIYGSLNTLSGGYIYDRKLVEYLRRQGDQVEVISLTPRDYSRHLSDNFSTALLRCLEQLRLDVLLQDELNHPSLFWLNRSLRKRANYPLVSIVHHLRSSEARPAWQNLFYRWVERRYLFSVDAFVFNSRATRQVVESLVGTEHPAVIAYPGGDRLNPVITTSEIHSRAHLPGPLRLVFVGNVIMRKNLHTLLEAAARLPSNDWSLSVAGRPDIEPAYLRRLLRQVDRAGISQNVRFLGPVSDTTLATLLSESHIMMVPSSFEGYGIVYLEGMGYGLPAIGAACGGAGEIIAHGKNGYLVRQGDSVALAGYLHQLAGERDLLAEMGTTALHSFTSHPTWEKSTGRIRRFLDTL